MKIKPLFFLLLSTLAFPDLPLPTIDTSLGKINFNLPLIFLPGKGRENLDFTIYYNQYENQIIIESLNNQSSFSEPCDSGSLIVTSEDNRPVGLLFAGSKSSRSKIYTYAFVNHINKVLEELGVGIVEELR
ncbi:MAG: hypothetical protein AB1297_08905 [bacterium]